MLKLLIRRLILIGGLSLVALVCTTCNDNDNEDMHHLVIPTYNYQNILFGTIYLNCNKTPAANYLILLGDGNPNIDSIHTDNNGNFHVNYSYQEWAGNWTPSQWGLYLPKDSINIILSHDTSVASIDTIKNFSIVIDDTLHFKAVFKFGTPYTSSDTLYYVLNTPYGNYKYIIGPFSPRVDLNFDIPEKDLQIGVYSTPYSFNWGMGFNNFIYYGSPNYYKANYKNCSPLDSLVINY